MIRKTQIKNKARKKKKNSTNIVDHDIAEKLLVNKSTEHDHLRFADVDRGVTTENIPKKSIKKQSWKIIQNVKNRERERVPARLGRSAPEIGRRSSNPVMHFFVFSLVCACVSMAFCVSSLTDLVQSPKVSMKKQLSIQFCHKFCLSGLNVIITLLYCTN